MSGGNGETKPIDDVESQPISRSTSPMPMPPIGRPTMRGEHYSYETVRLTAEYDKDDDDIRPLKEIKGKNEYLNVKRNGIGRRRSSGASSISGFTSGAMSD